MEALDNGVWRLRGFSFNEILNIIDGSLPLLKGLDDTGKKNTKGNIRLKDIKKTKSNAKLEEEWVRHVERDGEPVKFLWWGVEGKKKYLQVSKLDTETKSDKETDILISVITKKNGTQKRKRGGKLGRGRKKRRSRTNKKRRKKRRRRKTLNRRSPKRRRSFKKRK